MLHVVLDWQKIHKISWHFYLFLVLLSKDLKNGPSEMWKNLSLKYMSYWVYKKIENFMLIWKMQLCISDEMPSKKVKIKKTKKSLGKIRKLFFYFNFLGEYFFVTKTSLLFWNFLIPYMTYSNLRKKNSCHRRTVFQIFQYKNEKR